MILLLGSDAYSPFRMDALKDAIAKLDPSLRDCVEGKFYPNKGGTAFNTP